MIQFRYRAGPNTFLIVHTITFFIFSGDKVNSRRNCDFKRQSASMANVNNNVYKGTEIR